MSARGYKVFSRSAQQLPAPSNAQIPSSCTSLPSLAVLPVCPTAPAGTCLPGAKANTWQAGFCIQPQPVLIRTLRPLSGTPAGKAPWLLPNEKDKAIQSSISFRPCLFACPSFTYFLAASFGMRWNRYGEASAALHSIPKTLQANPKPSYRQGRHFGIIPYTQKGIH